MVLAKHHGYPTFPSSNSFQRAKGSVKKRGHLLGRGCLLEGGH